MLSMKQVKALTIRLSADQADALDTVANVENRPVSEIIRAAIDQHIEGRRRDPSFQRGLQERITRARKLLKE